MQYFDPLGRPKVTIGSDYCFQNLAKQNKFQAKTMLTTDENVGLAEWIIDDTCLVDLCFYQTSHHVHTCSMTQTKTT